MKKVLVVGEHSYIGDSFCKHIQNDDNIKADVVNAIDDKWKEIDFSKYDVVYLVAGIAHVKETASVTSLFEKINYKLAVDVAKHSKECGVKQFIMMSSMSVFGESGKFGQKKIINDETNKMPVNNYGKFKLLADEEIEKLRGNNFKIATIRPPMVYGKGCKGNFNLLTSFANRSFVFPKINNERSMIYIENLVEFIKLLINNELEGYFYPQNKNYVVTSEMIKVVRKISKNKSIWLTRIFNPILWILSKFIHIINKVFGNLTYDKQMSDTFGWKYDIVDFEESIRRSL